MKLRRWGIVFLRADEKDRDGHPVVILSSGDVMGDPWQQRINLVLGTKQRSAETARAHHVIPDGADGPEFTTLANCSLASAKTQAKNRFSRSMVLTSTLDLNPVTTGTLAGIAQGTINRPNPSLQPWTADTFESHLEYYSRQGGVIENGKVYRQRDAAAGFAGHRYYPPYTTVDLSIEYSVTRWAKLFLSGRHRTDAQKLSRRDVQNAPEWSTFHIANNLGSSYTADVTGSF